MMLSRIYVILMTKLKQQQISTMKKYVEDDVAEDGEIQDDEEQNQSDEQFIKTTKAGRKDICKMCRNALAKYTCPRCAERTCSLGCTRKHKELNDCKGYLDPTEKVSKGKIDEKVVQKDYQFVGSMISGSDKVRKCLTGISNNHPEPKRFAFLKKEAKNQHNITIHQAPAIIERHRQNISFYYMKTKQIYWIIELLYFQGDKKFTRHLLTPTSDLKTVKQILPEDFICRQLLLKGINTMKKNEFVVFIEDKDSEKGKQGKMLEEVGLDSKLREILKNKNIFEFPTLLLVHSSLKQEYMSWKKLKVTK